MSSKSIQYLLLEPGYLPCTQIDLKQKEYFTQKSFKHIIDQAMKAHRDYYLSVAKFKHSEEWQVLDALEYCKYLKTENSDISPISNLGTVEEIEFYQIDSNDSWEDLEKYDINHFCSLQQLEGYYLHNIRLSDPKINLKKRYGLEYQLTMDYLWGQGTTQNQQKSIELTKKFSKEGNYFCQVQLSYYSLYGLYNVEQDLFSSSYWFSEAVRGCVDTDLSQYLHPNVLQQLQNLPSLQEA